MLVHELGHYLTAKAFDVRVLEFGIGFPPRAKVLRSRGETLWTLNWLPIGGFVRMEGEDGDAADDPRSFAAKPLRVRLVDPRRGRGREHRAGLRDLLRASRSLASPVTGVRIGEVEAGSPAAAAGLRSGDEIFGVAGETLRVLRRAQPRRRRCAAMPARRSSSRSAVPTARPTHGHGHAPAAARSSAPRSARSASGPSSEVVVRRGYVGPRRGAVGRRSHRRRSSGGAG